MGLRQLELFLLLPACSALIDFRRQNLKVDPRAVRVTPGPYHIRLFHFLLTN